MKRLYRAAALLLILALLTSVAAASPLCSDWFAEELLQARDAGLLPLSMENADLTEEISRAEVCDMLLQFWSAVGLSTPFAADNPFRDTDAAAVLACHELGLISGYGDGSFGPSDPLTRQQMFCILLRLMENMDAAPAPDRTLLSSFADAAAVAEWAQDAAASMLAVGVVTGSDGKLLPEKHLTREQALAMLCRCWEQCAFWGYWVTDAEPEPEAEVPVSAEPEMDAAEEEPEELEGSAADLAYAGESYEDKHIRIFGSLDTPRYRTQSEAEAHMVTITVPVWNFNTEHIKVQTSRTLIVHEAIADTVMAIFKEIFEGEEHFPIYAVGGYSWRGDGTSEHNWGLAIDINPNENYYVYHGVPSTGSYWKPGEDPYSIPADGDVVRAFAKYGFAWGGNAWQYTQDYMHFSYFGT